MNQSSDVKELILAAPDESQGRMTFKQISWVSRVMFASGMFKNTQTEAQAIVKVMAGSEMGMSPFESMNGIDIIEGQAVVKPHTIAARIKRTRKYDYKVKQLTALRCDIDYYSLENDKRAHLGTATFTAEMAQTAGLIDPQCEINPQTGTINHDKRTITKYKKGGGSWTKQDSCLCKDNYRNYPDDMMYARAMSRGTKRFTPDVFNIPVYTPDEIEEQREEDRLNAENNVREYDYLPTAEQKQIADSPEKKIEEPPADDDTDLPEDPDADENTGTAEDTDDYDDTDLIPHSEVDDEYRQRVQDDLRDLNLPQNARLRLLRQATGCISIKSIKNDHQWRTLREEVDKLMTEASESVVEES